jgi:hypothetical protein
MFQLTTVAALPSGAGSKAALPPEVGKPVDHLARLGYRVNAQGSIERLQFDYLGFDPFPYDERS